MMSEKVSFQAYVEKLSDDIPDFGAALDRETSYRSTCQVLRETLRRLRENQGVTQSDMAKTLGMSQSAVSKIETGDGDIGVITLCRYAGALGMRPEITFAPAGDAGTADDNAAFDASRIVKQAMIAATAEMEALQAAQRAMSDAIALRQTQTQSMLSALDRWTTVRPNDHPAMQADRLSQLD